jgi:hypothetical protein
VSLAGTAERPHPYPPIAVEHEHGPHRRIDLRMGCKYAPDTRRPMAQHRLSPKYDQTQASTDTLTTVRDGS